MTAPVARTIVLASTSAHRRELMLRVGFDFVVADPGLDEAPCKASARSPEEMVAALSEAKARAVQHSHPNALIIGSDQCAEIDGRVLGKPGCVQSTVDQLMLLSGRAHRLVTGLCLLDALSGRARVAVDIHTLRMRRLSRRQLERYVEADQSMGCAGGYRIESRGIVLFDAIDGQDYTAIIGLPMMRLVSMLGEAGVEVLGG